MLTLSRRPAVLFLVLTLLSCAAVAYSYWSSDGSGSGEVTTVAGAGQALTINQTATLAGMYPGDDAQTLSGTFDNPNAGPVYVASVTASIDTVTKASGAVAGVCDATDFTLASPTMTVGAQVPAGNGQGAWSGATIKFNNKTGTNQDACKGATVTISYSAA